MSEPNTEFEVDPMDMNFWDEETIQEYNEYLDLLESNLDIQEIPEDFWLE